MAFQNQNLVQAKVYAACCFAGEIGFSYIEEMLQTLDDICTPRFLLQESGREKTLMRCACGCK